MGATGACLSIPYKLLYLPASSLYWPQRCRWIQASHGHMVHSSTPFSFCLIQCNQFKATPMSTPSMIDKLHVDQATIISSGCLALRVMARSLRSTRILLPTIETTLYTFELTKPQIWKCWMAWWFRALPLWWLLCSLYIVTMPDYLIARGWDELSKVTTT